jgi:hypothetical protein
MTKIHIIPVDLGQSVDDIISADIQELHAKTLADIQIASEAKQRTQQVKPPSPEEQATAIVYQLLLGAYKEKLLINTNEMMAVASPIATSSALILRLKTYLRKAGNEYCLTKRMKAGVMVYELKPYNAE